ncbi:unnamed protein product [Dovyalis caffra]|uniref:t-SNARE coiled-coil homology domain-containing protein n=1 Tax=Dovyalis caffra TaxID=77055 RepID=A0AAV1RHD7_9ROSI|nr:unnamed protein product [Dovyalis caffra]
MNDLLTDSFVGDSKGHRPIEDDIEMGIRVPRSNSDMGMEAFNKQIQEVEKQLDKINGLLKNLKVDMCCGHSVADLLVMISVVREANEDSKSVTKASAMKAIKKRMEKDVDEVGKIARNVKEKIVAINKDCHNNEVQGSNGRVPGRSSPRAGYFVTLRQKIQDEYREVVERRVITVTGTRPDEETIDQLIETGNSEQIFQKAIQEQGRGEVLNTLEEIQERHDAVKEIEKKLLELKEIFGDLAVLVDAQGEILDNIESQDLLALWQDCGVAWHCINENVTQVANAVNHVQSGTTALQTAKKLQKNSRKWMCIAIIILLLIVAIIVVGVIKPWKSNKGA